jgi:hypothetical protein
LFDFATFGHHISLFASTTFGHHVALWNVATFGCHVALWDVASFGRSNCGRPHLEFSKLEERKRRQWDK